jgi:hypothetical protein
MFSSPQIMDKVIAGGIRLKAILVTCPSSAPCRLLAQGLGSGDGCRMPSTPEGQPHCQGAQRCEINRRVPRCWPVASPVDSDHQVIEVDPVQPLLIVSSAHGVID